MLETVPENYDPSRAEAPRDDRSKGLCGTAEAVPLQNAATGSSPQLSYTNASAATRSVTNTSMTSPTLMSP